MPVLRGLNNLDSVFRLRPWDLGIGDLGLLLSATGSC